MIYTLCFVYLLRFLRQFLEQILRIYLMYAERWRIDARLPSYILPFIFAIVHFDVFG